MQGEVVASRERPLTHTAFERSVSGVFSEVPGQLVGSREFPLAPGPGTMVRFLAGVRAVVRFQVRRFAVGLQAAGVLAGVRRRSFS